MTARSLLFVAALALFIGGASFWEGDLPFSRNLSSFKTLLRGGFARSPARGADEGRRGNVLYRSGAYKEAARLYQDGLDRVEQKDRPGRVVAGLWNNLGATHYRQQHYEKARQAFAKALKAAQTAEGRARAAYNAGNTAAQSDQTDAALASYKEALLADAHHQRARYNYEYLKRQRQRQKRRKNNAPRKSKNQDIQPSAYAKSLKAEAERLVKNRQYGAAYRLMRGGARKDSTVMAYRSFMARTGAVATINASVDTTAL